MTRHLGRVRPAHAATALRGALFLVEAAPGAVLFRPGNGIVEAFPPNRAGGADQLGLTLPDFTLRLPLTVRAKEEHDVLASARSGILPGPARTRRHGHLPTYLRHESISSGFRVFLGQASTVLLDTRSHALRHLPRPPLQRTMPPMCSRAYERAALRAPGETGGKSGAGRAGGGLRASRLDEPASSAEPTLNSAIRCGCPAARRENRAGPS